MTEYIDKFLELPSKFDRLIVRERVLISLATLVTLFMGWLILVHDNLTDAIQAESQVIASTNSAIHAEISSQTELRELQARAPNDQLRNRRDKLKDQLALIANQLDKTVSDFVDPVQMPILLEEVFARHQKLKLIRVVNLEPIALELDGQTEQTGMYRHALQLELEGRYFEIMEFLSDVEKSRWGLRWRSLNYAVTDYPIARVQLEVETLSRDPNVIGV